MKKSYILTIALLVLVGVSASAQQNMRTAYFLDGYTYAYKMNPALQGERGFFAIPALGKASLGVESNLGLSSVVYPSADGTLKTFLHPDVSSEDFLKNMRYKNLIMANADLPVIALGFRTGKAYHTLDVSLRADIDGNLTKDLFKFLKVGSSDGTTSWDISNFGARAEARAEIAYGLSLKIGEKVSVGARAKALVGLARADVAMDEMNLKLSREEWAVNAKGSASIAGPMEIKTKGETGSAEGSGDKDLIDFSSFKLKSEKEMIEYLKDPALGFAVDLGVSADILEWLTVSASVTDLGMIGWKDVMTASTPEASWSFDGFDDLSFDDETAISDEFEALISEFSDALNIKKDGFAEKNTTPLSATTHLGVEARMPFYNRLSVGLLGTHHFAGAYSWTEGRASINWALLRFFALSGSYAISTLGNSCGAAVNIHLPGFTLFAGVDSFLPMLNVTPSYIPIDACNTNVTVGLNIAFGKYHGRYPKN